MRKQKFEYSPFLYITPPFLSGIIYGYYSSDFITAGIIFLVLLATSLLFYKTIKELTASVLFIVLGFLLISQNRPTYKLNYDVKQQYIAEISEIPQLKGRYWNTNAVVIAFKDGNVWKQDQNIVQLNIDTAQKIQIGNIITYLSKNYAFDSIFKNYYNFKGIYAKQYTYKVIIVDSVSNFRYKLAQLRDNISHKITRLDTTKSQAAAIMNAVTVGDKRDMNRTTKNDYKNAGVSHLLAVSGLHVGIIFAILNSIISSLRRFRYGSIIQSLIVLIVLWVYAGISGFSPSVLRAVIMFSFFTLGELFCERKNSLNILLASAFLILVIDPISVFNVSFQLSYVAMIGIITLYKPIRYLLQPKTKVLFWAWKLFVITFSAQMATAPLILFYFKQVSLIGFIVNYIVWFTIPIIILATLIFICTNIHLVGMIGIYCADIQNIIIDYFSHFSFGIIKIGHFSFYTTIFSYTVMLLIITYATYHFNKSYNKRRKMTYKRDLKA